MNLKCFQGLLSNIQWLCNFFALSLQLRLWTWNDLHENLVMHLLPSFEFAEVSLFHHRPCGWFEREAFAKWESGTFQDLMISHFGKSTARQEFPEWMTELLRILGLFQRFQKQSAHKRETSNYDPNYSSTISLAMFGRSCFVASIYSPLPLLHTCTCHSFSVLPGAVDWGITKGAWLIGAVVGSPD